MGRHNTVTRFSTSRKFWVLAMAALLALLAGLLVGQPFSPAPAHAATGAAGAGGLFTPLQTPVYDTRGTTYAGNTGAMMTKGKWYPIKIEGVGGIPTSGVSAVQLTLTEADSAGSGNLKLDKGDVSNPDNLTPYLIWTGSDRETNAATVAVGSDGTVQVYSTNSLDLVVEVQGYYSSGNTAAGGFVPLIAKQISNTGTTYTSGQSATYQVSGLGGVPTGASSVMLEVLANVPSSAPTGYIQVYPTGAKPSVPDGLDYPAGENSIWTSAVQLSASGQVTISFVNGGAVSVQLAVEGYFTPSTSTSQAGAFTPGRGRVLDTTSPSTPLGASGVRKIQVTGVNGIPQAGSGITSVAVGVTLMPGVNAQGNVKFTADNTSAAFYDQAFYPSQNDSGFAIVKLGPDGGINIQSNITGGGTLNAFVDIEGWFSSGSAAVPSGQTSTQQNLTLQGTEAPGGGTYATYEYENGTTGNFTPVPVSDVTVPGTTTHPTSWPVAQNSSGTFDPYTWNVASTLNNAASAAGAANPTGALVQVEACFGTSATDSAPVCSMPTNVSYAPSAFGGSRDTTSVGPGSLSLLTGDYEVSATDADATSSLDDLSVGRTLTTLAPAAANTTSTGVFGPGWTADLSGPDAGDATLSVSDNAAQGYELFTDTDGSTDTYAATTPVGTYPTTFTGVGDNAGDGSIVTKVNASSITMTDDDGTVTNWTKTGSTWAVTSVAEAGSQSTSTYTTSTTGATSGLVTRILGPVPAGVTCTTSTDDTTPGCRSLILNYETLTVAGTSVERLASVSTSLPQTSGTSNVTAVAAYDYTSDGHLADTYDPRITPNLKEAYTYNSAGRLATLTPPGEAAWSIGYDSIGRVSTVNRPDPSGATATTTVVYGLPFTGSSAPVEMGVGTTSTWGETADLPATATAVFSPDHVPAGSTPSTVTSSDWPYASIDYLDVNGQEVNTAAYGAGAWQIDTTQYDSSGDDIWDLTAGNRAQALTPTSSTDPYVAGLSSSVDRANALASTTVYNPLNLSEVTDTYGPTHPITLSTGAVIDGQDHTNTVYDEGAPTDPDGGSYGLPTTVTTDAVNAQTGGETTYPDAKISHLGYAAVSGMTVSGWTLAEATTSTIQMGSAPSSADLTTTTAYNPSGQVTDSVTPAGTIGSTQDTTTSYFTATGTGACVNAASAGLVCSTGPAKQPSTGNPLPVTTYTYDADGNTLTQVDTAGSTVRTTTDTYDAGERPLTSGITVTPTAAGGTALPTVTSGYDPNTGLPTTTSTGTGMTAQTDTTAYNNVGEATSYTDSTGNVSTTSYDLDGRPVSVGDGKGATTYTYDSSTEHRGLVTSENLNIAGMPSTFYASYDASGAMTTETYPNGLTAASTFDNTGAATSLAYAMGGSTWMNFTETRGIDSQIVGQSSPLSTQNFTYDQDDRLTTVQDSVSTGQATSCATRQYGFDADSNRTSLATYAAGNTGACSTSTAPTTVNSTYDQADRLTNTGYAYDTLGRTTTVPAVDANGVGQYASDTGNLAVGYYSNDMVNTETQGAGSLSYGLDPEQDRIATVVNGSTITTNHYSDDSDSPTWSSSGGSNWTRSLDGIDGGYAASEDQTGAVTLELANMHGDIVATALDATTDTGIQTGSYNESTEYGIDRNASTGSTSYGWLGSKKRSDNSLSGFVLMGVRLYDPNTGRFLSTDPIYGGNANPYVYPTDPIGASDITGKNLNSTEDGAGASFPGPWDNGDDVGMVKKPHKPTGGESNATRYGRLAHKITDYGDHWEKEQRIPKSNYRVDHINYGERRIIELKPDNPRAIKRGEAQVRRYVKAAERYYGGTWRGEVRTYPKSRW